MIHNLEKTFLYQDRYIYIDINTCIFKVISLQFKTNFKMT